MAIDTELKKAEISGNSFAIREFLSSPGEILAVTHIYPDGDAVGSMLAFGGMCEQLGARPILAVDDDLPVKYDFMPGYGKIRNLKSNPLPGKFSRVAILDAGALPRIGAAQHNIGPETTILNIDHHYTGNLFGDFNLVNPSACATSELLYDLCRQWKLDITPQIAVGLYVGILTDTGRFRFANTNSRALQICGDLVARGVNPGLVTERIYYDLPFSSVKALGVSLSSLEQHKDGRISLMSLRLEDSSDDTEGFVEFATSVRGVELAGFIGEIDSGMYKVSLRSRCAVDVSEIARRFGGGGHRKAAGFRFRGALNVLKEQLLESMIKELDDGKDKSDSNMELVFNADENETGIDKHK